MAQAAVWMAGSNTTGCDGCQDDGEGGYGDAEAGGGHSGGARRRAVATAASGGGWRPGQASRGDGADGQTQTAAWLAAEGG